MTEKMNLTSLVNYFDKRDPKIAEQIKGIARKSANKTSQPKKKALDPSKLKAVASVLVKIADELDESDPKLASEADSILKDLKAQMAMSPSGYCAPGEKPTLVLDMSPQMEDNEDNPNEMEKHGDEEEETEEADLAQVVDQIGDDLPLEEDLPLDEDPEPEPEFDKVTLDEFKDRINGLTFRLTDKDRRNRWESAHELAEKAVRHLEKGRELMDRAHSRLDEGGDAIRFKTDFSW